jgi:hypothetical protein
MACSRSMQWQGTALSHSNVPWYLPTSQAAVICGAAVFCLVMGRTHAVLN